MDNFEQETLANLSIVRNITQRLGGGTQKGFGQNFLVNQKTLLRFLDLLDIQKDDIIIEIGPGIGVLSYTLCQRAKKVYLIEIDRTKEEALKKVLENYDNYEIIWDDATNFDFSSLKIESAKVIGSLPYNVGKRIIYNLFFSNLDWLKAVFLLQKEVAESYSSLPPKADFLSTFARIFSQPDIRFLVGPKNFYPIPKVDSAAILFERVEKFTDLDKQSFSKFIKQGYIAPRKTIFNNLNLKKEQNQITKELGFSPTIRPSELSIDDWYKLYIFVKNSYL